MLAHQRFLFLFLTVYLVGCSAAPFQYKSLDTDAWTAVELSETPFYPQEDYQCGPAALATVLQVAGVADATPESLVSQVYLPDREGSLQAELLAATRRADRIPFVIPRRMDALFAEVAAGYPVLVLQNLGLERWPIWHYAVVIGFEPGKQQLILRSGTTEREVVSLRAFERSWRLGNYWAMVVPPIGFMPESVPSLHYFEAVAAVEQQGRLLLASMAYAAGTERWPEDATGYMGLGSIAYQQHDYANAEAYFYRATELSPLQPAGFFNLAWSLLRQERDIEALAAAQVAQELAPEHPRYGQAVVLIRQASAENQVN
ncbi:MAG: PA2778 family cysteine peptidase [Aliidiomarina sp.]|uniref:PA2778 family cysteine peptidase n=1 Tax=Aliidiomarina sp. TaxID=1872439 RepID=UPI0025B8E72C|nr:PA2778 family cysteine peptidase [Aliidiomarina sp.]MCH8500415.1 PA2778 family cysteine peptidase [Aliidiomarina sp.]